MPTPSYYIVAPTQLRAYSFAVGNKIGNATYYSYDRAAIYLRGCRVERIVFVGDPPKDVWQALQPALIGATEVLYYGE